MRWFRHLFAPAVRTRFEAACMERIQGAIAASEQRHRAQICFAVERSFAAADLFSRVSVRERADAVFSQLRVWDTERNNGVLIYVLLAEHAIEVVPDRDARVRIAGEAWDRVCAEIAHGIQAGRHADAIVAGIEVLTQHLATHYPRVSGDFDQDELTNAPSIL